MFELWKKVAESYSLLFLPEREWKVGYHTITQVAQGMNNAKLTEQQALSEFSSTMKIIGRTRAEAEKKFKHQYHKSAFAKRDMVIDFVEEI